MTAIKYKDKVLVCIGIEVVDQIITLAENPSTELSKKFEEQSTRLDLQESHMAAQRKIIDKYVAKNHDALTWLAKATMKRKRAALELSPARLGRQRGAGLSAPILQAVQEARE